MTNLETLLSEKKATSEDALLIFDSLESIKPDFMFGEWRGDEIFTGHPMEGNLQRGGWAGKEFKSPEEVSPLVYYANEQRNDTFWVDPYVHFKNRSEGSKDVFIGTIRDKVETNEYKARLRQIIYRGKIETAMIYDNLPIHDIFKKIDENTVLGVMDYKIIPQPYFFILKRKN